MSTIPQLLSVEPDRCPREEFVSALTHGVGLGLSVAAGIPLLMAAASCGSVRCLVGCAFYALTLVAVYAASTLSHLMLPPQRNRLWRAVDQACIYLLIVGTFTPFALTLLTSPGWLVFYALMMTVACAGFLSKIIYAHRIDRTCIWLYLALAWGEAFALVPMLGVLPTVTLYWIVAGGVCYTVGTIFLGLDLRRYHFHAIWHLLVIAGSACHYVAILQLVGGTA